MGPPHGLGQGRARALGKGHGQAFAGRGKGRRYVAGENRHPTEISVRWSG